MLERHFDFKKLAGPAVLISGGLSGCGNLTPEQLSYLGAGGFALILLSTGYIMFRSSITGDEKYEKQVVETIQKGQALLDPENKSLRARAARRGAEKMRGSNTQIEYYVGDHG